MTERDRVQPSTRRASRGRRREFADSREAIARIRADWDLYEVYQDRAVPIIHVTEARLADLLRRVGARLKQLRQERRLTQEQLAEKAGLSYKFVGEIERGTGNPSVTTLASLATALDVDAGEFFTPSYVLAGVSAQEITTVREALDSIEAFLNRASPTRKPTRYRVRRR